MFLVSVDVLAFVLHVTTNSKVSDALKKVVSQLPGKFASFYVVRRVGAPRSVEFPFIIPYRM